MVDFGAVNEGRRYVYDLLSRLYEREVDEELLGELTSAAEGGELARRFEALAELDERVGRGLDLMLGYLRSAAGRARKDVVLELAAEYASLFLGVKGTPPHPSESAYMSAGHLMYQEQRDEVMALYRDMGVDKVREFTEPEDHVAVELSFMSYLIGRTLEEWGKGNLGEVRRLLEIQRRFLREHLLKWVHRFAEDVESSAEVDFYRGLAYLTDGFLELDESSMDDLVSMLTPSGATQI
ncbi:MAG: TorD/DmsD family molecular chaperone [Conexivisphaera sp.]